MLLLLLPLNAASGPGRREEAVDVAVKPEMEVEVAEVLFDPTESERVIIGFAEDEEVEVGRRVVFPESGLLVLVLVVLPAVVAELKLRFVPDTGEGP